MDLGPPLLTDLEFAGLVVGAFAVLLALGAATFVALVNVFPSRR